jgi:WD40 repeat protein
MDRSVSIYPIAVLAWLSAVGGSAAQWTKEKVRPPATEGSAAFSPDGRSLAVLDGKGAVHVWDVATGKKSKKISLDVSPDESAERVRYTPDGELTILLCRYSEFASGPGWFRQGTISARLWKVFSRRKSPLVEVGYGGLAICPRGELLAYGDGLWEVPTGKKVRKVALPEGWIFHIQFSSDGKKVLYQISEGLAQDVAILFVADATTGKELLQIGKIDLNEYCFYFGGRFSADGGLLACSQGDSRPNLHLWDLTARKLVRSIPLAEAEEIVGFSPDSRAFVSWRRPNGGLHIWETATGKQRRATRVQAHLDDVLLSPDGKTVALRAGMAIEFSSLDD